MSNLPEMLVSSDESNRRGCVYSIWLAAARTRKDPTKVDWSWRRIWPGI